MSQTIFTSINPAVTSGSDLATILTDLKEALVSGMSGTTRPTELDPGGIWIDTNSDPTWKLQVWTGTIDVTVAQFDKLTGTITFSGTEGLFNITQVSDDTVGPILKLIKKRVSGGQQTIDGDTLGELQFVAKSSDASNPILAKIISVATDSTSPSAAGAYLAFSTTDDGTAVLAEKMRLVDGKLAIGLVSPDEKIHVKGNIKLEQAADDALAAKAIFRKKRIANSGQVLQNDLLGSAVFQSTDDTGAVVADAMSIEVKAVEDHTTTAKGVYTQIKSILPGDTTPTVVASIDSEFTYYVPMTAPTISCTDLFADNYNVGTMVEYEDAQLILNKGGTQATANAASSGFKVEMSDATDFVIGYDSTLASKVKAGDEGAEKELINVDAVQNLSNKTLINVTYDKQDIATAVSITGLSATKAIVNFTGSTATDVHGIDASAGTKAIIIHNSSTATVTIKHQSGTEGTATNRISLPNGKDLKVLPDTTTELFYLTGTNRWRIKSGSSSAGGLYEITVGTTSVSGSGTITPDSAVARQVIKVVGNGGAVTGVLLADGQEGQEVTIIGTSDTNTVELDSSDANVVMNGNFTLYNGSLISFVQVGGIFYETVRRA